jgi:hypothetical protein
MMPEVETPHPHPHARGRKLDLVLPVCALFVSVISLILAMIHGQAMERMADANARLVQANSWPLLEYVTGNQADNGDLQIYLRVHNAGVGPAKLETFEVFWNGKPMRSNEDLLRQCCGYDPALMKSNLDTAAMMHGSIEARIAAAKKASQSAVKTNYAGTGVTGLLEAHETSSFLILPLTPKTAPVWQKLNGARMQLQFRACYCSVFDECWISNLRTLTPPRVKVCPTPRLPFTD